MVFSLYLARQHSRNPPHPSPCPYLPGWFLIRGLEDTHFILHSSSSLVASRCFVLDRLPRNLTSRRKYFQIFRGLFQTFFDCLAFSKLQKVLLQLLTPFKTTYTKSPWEAGWTAARVNCETQPCMIVFDLKIAKVWLRCLHIYFLPERVLPAL